MGDVRAKYGVGLILWRLKTVPLEREAVMECYKSLRLLRRLAVQDMHFLQGAGAPCSQDWGMWRKYVEGSISGVQDCSMEKGGSPSGLLESARVRQGFRFAAYPVSRRNNRREETPGLFDDVLGNEVHFLLRDAELPGGRLPEIGGKVFPPDLDGYGTEAERA